MSLEVLERADDARANREPGPPADGANLRGIEEDERIVADPAALAARVVDGRRGPKVPGDPANRLVDVAVLVGAEIVDVDLVAGAFDRHQDRVDAVLNVQIGLALPAVAQHP